MYSFYMQDAKIRGEPFIRSCFNDNGNYGFEARFLFATATFTASIIICLTLEYKINKAYLNFSISGFSTRRAAFRVNT